MIETKDIVKMVKHIVRHDNGVPDTRIMHPMREWLIGLSGVTVGIIGGSIFALLVYHSYSLSARDVMTVAETVVPYKAVLVEQALDTYLEKRRVYESLTGVSTPVLPQTELSPSNTSIIDVMATTSVDTSVSEGEDSLSENEGNEGVSTPDLAI